MQRHIVVLIIGFGVAAGLAACLPARIPTPQPTSGVVATATASAVSVTATFAAPTVVPSPTLSDTPSPTLPPSPTPSPVPTQTPTLTATASPTVYLTPTSTPSPTLLPQEEIAVVRVAANVRGGPDTTYPVLTAVRQGARLVVIGRNSDASWLEIVLPSGRSGWIIAGAAQVEISAAPTLTPTPTVDVSAPASPTATVIATGSLQIEASNARYECVNAEWQSTTNNGDTYRLWGYRRFKVNVFIQNNSGDTLTAPWAPHRWIITDSRQESTSDLTWRASGDNAAPDHQPDIQPGQRIGWTFIAFPIDREQWVEAVEFILQGHTYRLELSPDRPGGTSNYTDCGAPSPHPDQPTPTPRP